MNVITIQSEALHVLIEEVIQHLATSHSEPQKTWLTTTEAMALLNIRSKTTMQNLRNNGCIKYTQMGKLIQYDRASILQFLEDNSREPFKQRKK